MAYWLLTTSGSAPSIGILIDFAEKNPLAKPDPGIEKLYRAAARMGSLHYKILELDLSSLQVHLRAQKKPDEEWTWT